MNKQWVIADVHGCYKTFVNLLEYKVQLSQDDQLFLLGDYIDRGVGSKEIIDYIADLQESGYKVYTLRGNHEDVLFTLLLGTSIQSVDLRNRRIICWLDKTRRQRNPAKLRR